NNPGGAPVRLESLQTVSVTRDVLGKMRPLDLPTATTLTTGLKPPEQVVTAIPEKLQSAVDQRQGALALATALEVARSGLRSQTVNGRGGKLAVATTDKVSDGASSQDAIVPVAQVSEGTAVLVGGVVGSLDAAVGSLSTATSGTGGGGGPLSSSGLSLSSGSGGGALGGVVGSVLGGVGSSSGSGSSGSGSGSLLGNSGPGSIGSGGGGEGAGPGWGRGPRGALLRPPANFPVPPKKIRPAHPVRH